MATINEIITRQNNLKFIFEKTADFILLLDTL